MLSVSPDQRLPLSSRSKSRHITIEIGALFNRLRIIGVPFKRANKNGIYYDCECKCGVKTVVNCVFLRNGMIVSCGCRQRETGLIATQKTKTHGLSKHPLYAIWKSMIRRCYEPTCRSYDRYGGRGIIVSAEWRFDPTNFIKWAIDNGWRKGLQIDRENNDSNYSSDNCRIATRKENSRNTRSNHMITIDNKTKCVSEWCEEYDRDQRVIRQRIDLGWEPRRAFETPTKRSYNFCNLANVPTKNLIAELKRRGIENFSLI